MMCRQGRAALRQGGPQQSILGNPRPSGRHRGGRGAGTRGAEGGIREEAKRTGQRRGADRERERPDGLAAGEGEGRRGPTHAGRFYRASPAREQKAVDAAGPPTALGPQK